MTKEKIIEGWLHTGDLGKIDDDGFLYIYGRNNDLIILRNGKKVFPEEIESKLNKIDGIKESIVFENDSKINAKVVYSKETFKEMTEEEIYSSIIEKVKKINESLPQFKKVNDVVITSKELEKTPTGKIQRNIELKKIKEANMEIINDSNTNTMLERIKKVLTYKLGNKPITEESNIILELGADSLDMVEIILAIEKEFDIKIEKDKRKQIIKVKDLLDIVQNSIK